MANPLGLLLIGCLGCWLIGRLNRNYKTFFVCLVAMLLGFTAGATISKFVKPLEKAETAFVIMDNTENGDDSFMLCATEPSVVWKPLARYSSITSNKSSLGDILWSITPQVTTVHPRCLSPPSYVYSGYHIPMDYDSS